MNCAKTVECQAVKAAGTPPLFVDEIRVIFRKRLGNIDEQFELVTEHMVWLPTPEDNLKSFKVGSLFEGSLHPLRLGHVDPQQGDAVRLGISLGNFLGDVTTEYSAMERRRFVPKLCRITAHAEEESHRACRRRERYDSYPFPGRAWRSACECDPLVLT